MPTQMKFAAACVLVLGVMTASGAMANSEVAATESTQGGALQAAIFTLDGDPIAHGDERTRSDSSFKLVSGDQIQICVRPPKAGFVTVWSRTPAESGLTLLYPNDRSHPSGNKTAPIKAGENLCLGTLQDSYRINVKSGTETSDGTSEVFIMWSQCAQDQLSEEDLPTISDRAVPPARACPVASTTMTYTVEG